MSKKTNEIWTWKINEEGTALCSPTGELWFNYDKQTREIKIEPTSQWYNTSYDDIPYSDNGELTLIQAGERYIHEKFAAKKNIYFAKAEYKTDEEGDINRIQLKLPLIESPIEIKYYDIEQSIRNDFILDYFKDVKNPHFQKLRYSDRLAIIEDMITNIDWLGEYHDKTNKESTSLPLSFVKENIEHKNWNNEYSYFNLNNQGQHRHYAEVLNEWRERNPRLFKKLLSKDYEDRDKKNEDNVSYSITKNLDGNIFVSDFNNAEFEKEIVMKNDEKFRYMLLDRMKTDCEYYLGNGNRNKEKLWSRDENDHIKNMISLYRSFGVKGQPEWLSVTDLNYYSKELTSKNIDEIMDETIKNNKEEKAFLKKNNELFTGTINELNNATKVIDTENKLEKNLNSKQKNEIIDKASSISENQTNNQNNKNTKIDDINITSSQIEDSYKELNEIEKIFKSKKGEMYQTFLDFKDKGLYDIQGKKITVKNNTITDEGWNELYTAAQIYRNKKFETMRYIFIDPYFNKVRDQMTLSSYLPNLCIMTMGNQTTSEVISHAEKNNLYVIACHNHPSGNVDPSDADINSTNRILDSMTNNHGETRFLGHIILDHNSYSYYSPRSGWHKGTIEENINILEEQHNSTIENKLNLNKIDGPRSLALFSTSEFFNEIVKEVNESNNYSDNYIPVIYCDSSFKIKSFKYYNNSTFFKNKEGIKELFINDAIETGSFSYCKSKKN